jgi:hypothetical protein
MSPRSERFAGGSIDVARQNDPQHHLDVRLVRFHPDAGSQFSNYRRLTDAVADVDVGAVAHCESQEFAAIARMGVAKRPLLSEYAYAAIGLSQTPARLGRLERVANLRLCTRTETEREKNRR